MLQINNLHASVGDKPILKGLTLALGVAACNAAPVKSGDCTLLSQQRQNEIEQTLKEFRAANPNLNVTNPNDYPSLKDGERYQEWQARLDQIENRYRAKCPKAN